MKQYIISIILLLASLTCTAGAADHNVNAGESIQAAINSAFDGDTIYVHAGTYTENVDVNKRLTLRVDGADAVTVTANVASDHVFEVTVDHVNISGFTVTGATGFSMAGIYLNCDADHCSILDNSVSGNYGGIYLQDSKGNTLTGNTISDNGDGIRLNQTSDNTLTGNTISDNNEGIRIIGSTNNSVIDNTIPNNRGGILLTGRDDTWTRGNKFYNNIITKSTFGGIAATKYSSHNLFSGNTVSENGYHGIHLQSSSNNILSKNFVSSNNRDGIRLSYSSCNNTLTENIASANNDGGICLYGTDNSIMTGNVMSGNGYHFDIGGSSLSHFIHDIGESNTVDGKPMCYWVRQQDRQVPGDAGFGFVGIIDSTNITVTDMTLTNNMDGILFAYTNNSRIEGVTLSDNCGGVYLRNSNNNDVIGSNISGNSGSGIFLTQSSDNRIYNNYFANTENACDDGTGTNAWNTTKTTGPNIVGGSEIGGNYWSDYTGIDSNGDGFGDEPYDNITYSTGTDYLPLVLPVSMCGDITGDGTIDTVDLLLLLEHVVTGTSVDACTGDIDGNGRINVLDVRLLMGYIHDPKGYLLNCPCADE